MVLLATLVGTLVAGIGSVWLAALLSFGVLARYTQHMLSLAAGALLATAFMHLLPEAFEAQVAAHELFLALLLGLVFFFCSTRPNCGTTGMSMHTPATTMTLRTRMSAGLPIRTTPDRGALGRCSRATACTALATGC